MGIKIKKELKPQQKLTPLDVKYLFAVPLIGIVDIFTMISFYNKLPAEGMLGAKIFYIFFALVGAGFAYWGFMWKLTSDSKKLTVRPAFGTKKELKYDALKVIKVHRKKRNILVKIYPIMNNSGELMERLKRLGVKIEEFVDR